MKTRDLEEYTASELLDQVFVRMELLEGVLSRIASKSEEGGWVYQVMDVMEQIYDYLSMLKKKIGCCEECNQRPS